MQQPPYTPKIISSLNKPTLPHTVHSLEYTGGVLRKPCNPKVCPTFFRPSAGDAATGGSIQWPNGTRAAPVSSDAKWSAGRHEGRAGNFCIYDARYVGAKNFAAAEACDVYERSER